jgi:hypothetical protein
LHCFSCNLIHNYGHSGRLLVLDKAQDMGLWKTSRYLCVFCTAHAWVFGTKGCSLFWRQRSHSFSHKAQVKRKMCIRGVRWRDLQVRYLPPTKNKECRLGNK